MLTLVTTNYLLRRYKGKKITPNVIELNLPKSTSWYRQIKPNLWIRFHVANIVQTTKTN